jgi:hypothetical protein
MSEKFSVLASMKGVFETAAKERKSRQEMVADPVDPAWPIFGWILFEREQMHAAVNAERARRGLSPVDVQLVVRADRLASGHSDYSSKYPLYCTEIALGEDEPQP